MADFLDKNLKQILKGDKDEEDRASGKYVIQSYIRNNPGMKLCDIVPMSIVRSIQMIEYPLEKVIKEIYLEFGQCKDIFGLKTFVFHGRVSSKPIGFNHPLYK